jgi:hypothetical protein
MAPDRTPDPLAVALDVGATLERLGLPWLAAGSLASSLHGEPRSTNDVDIVVDLAPGRVGDLLAALGDRYYVDADTLREAARNGGAGNLIHYATAVKVDLFVAGDDAFDAERLAHRARTRFGPGEDDALWVDTAEHTILRKLEWYRRGGETAERQWRDVAGIVRAQGPRLDWGRMAQWAPRLGVSDLLERLRTDPADRAP